MQSQTNMDVEQFFLQHLREIERIIAFVCRRNHLDAQEAEEFAAHTNLKLIEDNYGILRKFEGRSLFSTYLTTVIQRLFFQYRVQLWGKWRPSAEAKRLGDKGITLERLLTRDGYTYSEAVEILAGGAEAAFTVAEIEAMYVRLPQRLPRPVLVSDADAPEVAAADGDGDAASGVLRGERERTARRTKEILDRTIATLDAEERIILQMRFFNGMHVPDIARALTLDAKKLYKRIDKLLSRLRGPLESAGLGRAEIDDLIAHRDHEVTLRLIGEGKKASSPSNCGDGGFGDGAKPPIGLR
jgi:RNA polymerase sigma factor for flagellar operon FliA